MEWFKQITIDKNEVIPRLSRILGYLVWIDRDVVAEIFNLQARGTICLNTSEPNQEVNYTAYVDEFVEALKDFDEIIEMEAQTFVEDLYFYITVNEGSLMIMGEGYIPDSVLGHYIEI